MVTAYPIEDVRHGASKRAASSCQGEGAHVAVGGEPVVKCQASQRAEISHAKLVSCMNQQISDNPRKKTGDVRK